MMTIGIQERTNDRGTLYGKGLGSPAAIDDRLPVPAGEHPAAVRLVAIYGVVDKAFGGNGEAGNLGRAALMWIVRIPEGALASMCHLVTLDPSPHSLVRRLAAALLCDASLLDKKHLDNGGLLLGRSCLLTVRRQWCGGRDRPTVAGAKPLPEGVASVVVPDTVLWTFNDDPIGLPIWFPPKFKSYANLAARADWEKRQQRGS